MWRFSRRAMQRFLLFLLVAGGLLAQDRVGSNEPAPSEFRLFTDKRDQQIEAQIVSLSENHRTLQIRRRDGQEFSPEVIRLSLDDQQFLRDWLHPEPDRPQGKLRVFGVLPNERKIDTETTAGLSDFVEVYALKAGWLARRNTGEVLAFGEAFQGLGKLRSVYCNTVWASFTKDDGSVWNNARSQISPEGMPPAVRSSSGGGAPAAIFEDGSVKIWGGKTGSRELTDPPPRFEMQWTLPRFREHAAP